MCEGAHAGGWASAAWEGIGQLEDQPDVGGAQPPRHASHEDHEDPDRHRDGDRRLPEARLSRRRMTAGLERRERPAAMLAGGGRSRYGTESQP